MRPKFAMDGASGDMSDKPFVDRSGEATGVRRLLVLGGFLLFLAAIIALFDHVYGGFALIAIFSVLAMVGIAAIFGFALGLLSFSGKSGESGIAARFLDTLETGTLVVDRKGRILYANRAYGEATGSPAPDEVKTLERILAREREGSEVVYRLANRAGKGEAAHEEFRLERDLAGRPGREPRWYRLSVRPVDVEGAPAHAWQIADITAERTEQELFFQNLQNAIDYLDHAPAGFFAADAKGRITYVNATLAAWLGFDLASIKPYERSVESLLGKDIAGYLAGDDGLKPKRIDATLLGFDGRPMSVRLHLEHGSAAEGAAGAVRAIVVGRDSEAPDENAVQAAELRFARVFNASPIAIASLDEEGRVLRANEAFERLFARSSSGPSGIADLVREEGRDQLRQAMSGARRHRSVAAPPIDVQIAGEPVRSLRLYFSGTSVPADGSRESVIVYGVDITEQRTLEEQFAKAQRMQAIGNLAGGIAHDFNNVLTIITASVDFLLLNQRAGDPSFQDLLLIKQSANRAASLVRQLLAYSRRQTMRPKMLSLTDVVADMHLLLRRISGDIVKLERHHARDLWPVMADIGQFEQVLTNLVQNARDAMPEGGTITISTRNVHESEVKHFNYAEMQDGDFVLVEVADTGTGMPPEVAERIFEPFFTTKEIGKGTGLGLSMVYGIIKQSGGFIFVDSVAGQGTNFRIFLPRHVPNEVAAAKSDAPSGIPTIAPENADLSGTASILLVEDEDHVRAGNVRALKMRGYEVYEASSGVEALEVLAELGGNVDLVVSDVVMPEMDGPTLLREMRSRQPDLKFIFVSGYAEDAFAKNLPEGEKFGFLAKPFSLRELAVAVKQMLDE
ncbi:cell cycle histidine kinase CckA [Aureimonas psammosilenae]|uniref:cell cycle histidine kinase CckA n=1 Tax=Aureimonas psammosilenae TaxID=2495496 RepID=UPI001F326F9D|nr:PAS domain-containing sensor histidine kinase [Aureimonas psammosilenae]